VERRVNRESRGDDRCDVERDIGAVLVPQVRVGGTIAGPQPIRPSSEYLRRFPPVGVIAFGRTPDGAASPGELVESVRRELAAEGEARCFAACDLEQGAGLHFPDATRLPLARALAAHDADGSAAWGAGALTALEARERGIELVLAPVADVATHARNPIVAVRAFGATAAHVGVHARAFLAGLHAGGAGGTAKHFPGHGDTAEDSHLELARVARTRGELDARELAPFRELIAAGVDAVMVAHLDVPALTGEPGLAATLSPRVLSLLREELGFSGAVLTDALDMRALAGVDAAVTRALAAGCDGLVCPADPEAAAAELVRSLERGALSRERLRAAAERMRALRANLFARSAAGSTRPASESRASRRRSDSADFAAAVRGAPADRAAWARRLAGESLVLGTGSWPWKLGQPCEVLAPFPPRAGVEARRAIHALRDELVDPTGARNALLPVVAEVRAYDGRYGIEPDELRALEAKVADLSSLGWRVALAWFAAPETLPEAWHARADLRWVLAFAPTPPMVQAVGDFLRGRARPIGSLAQRAN
jgi:beta-glucosidase-like glycosyl hydrolase